MIKRFYVVAALVLALFTSLAVANGVGEAQKDKQKAKAEKGEAKSGLAQADQAQSWDLLATSGDRSYLGVYLEDVTAERAKELRLSEERGAVVMKVVAGGPAEKAGLKENDVIVAFNGRRVDSVMELTRLLGETPAGRNVAIEVLRGGTHQTLNASLSRRTWTSGWHPEVDEKVRKSVEESWKRAEEQFRLSEEQMKKALENSEQAKKSLENSALQHYWGALDFGDFFFVGPGERFIYRGGPLGIGVESLTDQLATFFGVKEGKGVLVTHVNEDSAAGKAGIKAGDVITGIDNEPVESVNGLIKALRKKDDGQTVLRVVRNKSEQTFTVTLEKRQTLLRPGIRQNRMRPVIRPVLVRPRGVIA
jgi:C-terminal processing protease CtpA/Prc